MKQSNKILSAAGLAFSVSAVLLLAFSLILQNHGTMAIIVSELVIIAITLGCAIFFKLDIKETFSLRKPTLKQSLLSALTALTLLPTSLTLASIMLIAIESIFGGIALPAALTTQTNFLATLLFFCVMPAVCEEMLFRGIVLSGLSSAYKSRMAIIACGILFGIFHMDIQRFIGQALLGVAIAFIVYYTRSIFCGMIIHFVNNAVAMGIQQLSQGASEALNTQDGIVSVSLLDMLKDQAAAAGVPYPVMVGATIFIYIIVAGIFAVISILLINQIFKTTKQQAAPEPATLNPSRKSLLFFIPGVLIIVGVYVSGIVALATMF